MRDDGRVVCWEQTTVVHLVQKRDWKMAGRRVCSMVEKKVVESVV